MTSLQAGSTSPGRHLEPVAVDVARVAADFVRSAIGHGTTARTKSSPTDVVTHTDLRSEEMIRSELLSRCPGSTVLGEEYETKTGTNDVGWIVDPIDGTVNFLYDLPVTAVSIAATVEGRVVAGAVVDVHRGDIFSSAIGTGARCNGDAIAASRVDVLSQALVGTGFSYRADLRGRQAQTLTRVVPACRDIRCMGSAALNLCWVGCGRLDAYYERDLKIYDYAAGALIAAEAGAAVELPAGNHLDLTIAASQDTFASLRGLVEPGDDG